MTICKDLYSSCTLCPHNCKANRTEEQYGFCKTGVNYNIASVCVHMGEEPVISGNKGICNIFFGHCNMQCVYCQNYQISNNCTKINTSFSEESILKQICSLLDSGCHAIGFVSPSHAVVQMVEIINKINKQGFNPVVVYNSNGYDKVETLKKIEPFVNIYLPDFKYSDDNLAYKLSGINNYTQTAVNAIREMIKQKGASLEINRKGLAIKGIIIRHLILPHFIENSKKVLQMIADNFGNEVHISLMSQYNPIPQVKENKELNKVINKKNYDEIVDYLTDLGFENGWIQEIDSIHNYNPDFNRKNPFEK